MLLPLIRLGALALLLAACQPTAPAHPRAPAGLSADRGGLQPLGTDLRIDFGRAQAGAIESVSRILGHPPNAISAPGACGAGPVVAAEWRQGLTLIFRDGDFLGWSLDAPGIAANGLSVGMSRAALPTADFADTSRGTEFETGGVFGLIPPGEDRVARLWSGVGCSGR